jgi:hypothetical protein
MLSPEEPALVPAFKAPSAAVTKAIRRIEVHDHAVPQAYVDGISSRTGLPALSIHPAKAGTPVGVVDRGKPIIANGKEILPPSNASCEN